MKEIENVFKPIPMAVFSGYKRIGTIYPEGWNYEGKVLKEAIAVPTEPKYMRKLQKELRK
jgi:hypothetical protein